MPSHEFISPIRVSLITSAAPPRVRVRAFVCARLSLFPSGRAAVVADSFFPAKVNYRDLPLLAASKRTEAISIQERTRGNSGRMARYASSVRERGVPERRAALVSIAVRFTPSVSLELKR